MEKPNNLGIEGSDFWDDMTATYEFTVAEFLILSMICEELDLIRAMVDQINIADLRFMSTKGTDTADPLAGEVNRHRSLVANLMKQLHLPADSAARSEQGKKAVETRWGKRGAA